MAHSVAPVSDFGGLDLYSSVDQSACIDMLNVDLDRRGSIRQRDGYDNFTGSALTNQAQQLHVHSESHLLAGCGTRLEAINTSGTVVASVTGLTAALGYRFARMGTPTASATYVGNGSITLRKWDGSSWSVPTATVNGVAAQDMPKGRELAVQSPDNRLVNARFNGATDGPDAAASSASHVYFSSAGDAETWDTDDFVILTPGDNEEVQALVAWRDLLFAFKQTKFFVFYGNSVDATGGTVFNYRIVDTGVGCDTETPRTVCATAGRDGVYFMNLKGIYRTTGGPPQLISRALDPLFRGSTSSAFTGPDTPVPNAIRWLDERLYVSLNDPDGVGNYDLLNYPNGWGHYTLVYDQGQWMLWDLKASDYAYWTFGGVSGLYFAYSDALTGKHIGKISSDYTDDDGTAISSHYRTGFSDIGYPGREKDIDSTRLWGMGTVAVAGSRDFGSLDTATNVTLGTSPAVAAGLHNKQKKGELISYKFSSVSGGAWTLHRYAHYLRGIREGGLRSD